MRMCTIISICYVSLYRNTYFDLFTYLSNIHITLLNFKACNYLLSKHTQ